MSTKAEIAEFRKLRRRCVMPVIFAGWTPKDTFDLIEKMFCRDLLWLGCNILHPSFRSAVVFSKRTHWSYGYCFEIVEVAKLIFDAAGLDYTPYVKVTKKKARGRLKKHHVLKLGGFCFDPARGPNEAWGKYTSYDKGRQLPQCPGARTVELFRRLLWHGESDGCFNGHQLSAIRKFEKKLPILQSRLKKARLKGRRRS